MLYTGIFHCLNTAKAIGMRLTSADVHKTEHGINNDNSRSTHV